MAVSSERHGLPCAPAHGHSAPTGVQQPLHTALMEVQSRPGARQLEGNTFSRKNPSGWTEWFAARGLHYYRSHAFHVYVDAPVIKQRTDRSACFAHHRYRLSPSKAH